LSNLAVKEANIYSVAVWLLFSRKSGILMNKCSPPGTRQYVEHYLSDSYSAIVHGENKLHSMRLWWCPLCTRPTCL